MQTKTGLFHGSSLAVELHAARRVVIEPRDDLRDAVAVEARFEDVGEFDDLTVTEGGPVILRQKPTVQGNVVAAGNNSVVIGGDLVGGSIVIGGDLNINGQTIQGGHTATTARPVTLELTIGVPRGFPLTLALSGSVPAQLGDIDGDLDLTLSGHSRVSVGVTGPLDATLSGSATADVRGVRKALSGTISGSGRLNVGPCDIDRLKVGASGSGVVMFAGSARRARLDAKGQIEVQEVRERLECTATGSGRITVHKGAVEDFEATAAGSAKVRFQGRADDASITASGSASVQVAEVTGALKRTVSGSARAQVGNRPEEPKPRGRWF